MKARTRARNGVFRDVDFAKRERFCDHLLEALLQHFETRQMRRAVVDSPVLDDALTSFLPHPAAGRLENTLCNLIHGLPEAALHP